MVVLLERTMGKSPSPGQSPAPSLSFSSECHFPIFIGGAQRSEGTGDDDLARGRQRSAASNKQQRLQNSLGKRHSYGPVYSRLQPTPGRVVDFPGTFPTRKNNPYEPSRGRRWPESASVPKNPEIPAESSPLLYLAIPSRCLMFPIISDLPLFLFRSSRRRSCSINREELCSPESVCTHRVANVIPLLSHLRDHTVSPSLPLPFLVLFQRS